MADRAFFHNHGPFPLTTLLQGVGAQIKSAAVEQEGRMITDVAALDLAESNMITFFDHPKYFDQLQNTRAGACLVREKFIDSVPKGVIVCISQSPYHAYAQIAEKFYPAMGEKPGISPHAMIETSATLGKDVSIGPGAVLESGCQIGDGVIIGANSVIGKNVRIGAQTRIAPQVVLQYCHIGMHCILHPGVKIGQDGFGFALGSTHHRKVPQLGRVIIGNRVEIGANTTIDRGAGPDTIIEDGVIIDNLVQVGHNVIIGELSVISGHSAIAGSAKLGKQVMMGGKVGVAGHLTIGEGARISAGSGIARDVPAGAQMMGSPALPSQKFWRRYAYLTRLFERKEK